MPKRPEAFPGLTSGAVLCALAWIVTTPLAAQTRPDPGATIVDVIVPAELDATAQLGKRIFDVACASCHGPDAAGQEGVAPPLIHRIYEPSHHGDEAFQLAVAIGVRAHHWRFGNMPPVPGLTRGDVAAIVAYIRDVQRANGID